MSGKPKHASVSEYSLATGFEAIFGYLHLTGDAERIRLLIDAAYADKI
jgi:23S rRNA maturation mini-RNase III